MLSHRVSRRIGLLNVMVFTHLPSNVLFLLIPLMPTRDMAIGVLLLRFAITQVDVPARQAYLMAHSARMAWPFFCAGGCKIVFDFLLLWLFRSVPLEEGAT